jgi:hypothetical protein
MIPVTSIIGQARKIIGSCDEVEIFRYISDGVALIANKLDLEDFKGYLDICAAQTREGTCITLPREVQTVIAVNIGGRPTLGKDQLFSFHLNGPGDCRGGCRWDWQDQGAFHAVYRDLVTPARLVAYLENRDDTGSSLIVYGYDDLGNRLSHEVSGQRRDGYPIPTVYGYAIPDTQMPLIARITGVSKDLTKGSVRLSTIDDSGLTGVLLAVYDPDETIPQFRRIKLGRNCGWARVAFKKSNPTITGLYQHIPLRSRQAFLLAMRALKWYQDEDFTKAHAFEADAARLEFEAQNSLEAPLLAPVQVVDINRLNDKCDYDIR